MSYRKDWPGTGLRTVSTFHFPGRLSLLCANLVHLRQQLQVIANICRCRADNSKALLRCLRAKSSQELQGIGQVKGLGQGCPLNGVDGGHT